MKSTGSYIIALWQGTLSLTPNKVLKGDVDLAHAAHAYYERYGQQTMVTRSKPAPADYDYADLGKLYDIVRYEVNDVYALSAWWYGTD